MTKYEVEDGIPCTNCRDLMDTFIKKGHDTNFLFEVLLRILFFIELGVSSWECHFHISHPWRHHHLIGESHQTDTDPDDDDGEEDIEHIIKNPDQ